MTEHNNGSIDALAGAMMCANIPGGLSADELAAWVYAEAQDDEKRITSMNVFSAIESGFGPYEGSDGAPDQLITKAEARAAIEMLLNLEFLSLDTDGNISRTAGPKNASTSGRWFY